MFVVGDSLTQKGAVCVQQNGSSPDFSDRADGLFYIVKVGELHSYGCAGSCRIAWSG